MQEHTIEVGQVLVIGGVPVTVLAIVGGEVFFGVGGPQPAPDESSAAQSGLSLEAWLNRSPN